jgi:hypothetical protein
MEQTLHTDQDNALFFSNLSAGDEAEYKSWFSMFSQCAEKSSFHRIFGPVRSNSAAVRNWI